jgi:hypothetical protein
VFNEVRQLLPPRLVKESTDFYGFDKHCRRALREDLTIGYEALRRWEQARAEVKAYLEDKTHEAEIQTAVTTIRYECFGLR